jgi:hypothetical protein
MTAFTTFGFMIVALMIIFVPEAKDHMELGIDANTVPT